MHLGQPTMTSADNSMVDLPALNDLAAPSNVPSLPGSAAYHTSSAQLGVVSCHTFSVPPRDTSPQGQVGTLWHSGNSWQCGFDLLSSSIAIRTLAILFIPRCHSSLSCINEYLATDRGIYVNE